ncbi:hypothetical protein LXL04_018917 [Taraxacum kok-saghyz]
MKPSSIEASFNPHGLKALIVDHNPTSLFNLSKMLQFYHYQVTSCPRPREALSLIRNGVTKFDIVINSVDFSSDMNGLQFLDTIISETDLPVVSKSLISSSNLNLLKIYHIYLIFVDLDRSLVVVSEDERKDTIIECVKKGACAYLQKPVRMEDIQLLWQHVARKEILRLREMKQIDSVENGEPDSSNGGEDKEFCGSSDGDPVVVDRRRKVRDEEQDKVERKKQRLVWTEELHQQFLDAVEQLGNNNAVPKKVLELMNVPGLTRENVASHLQKYRLLLKKQSEHVPESVPMPNSVSEVSVGVCNSMIRRQEFFQTTLNITELQVPLPLDHYYVDFGSDPIHFPNQRFHEYSDPSLLHNRSIYMPTYKKNMECDSKNNEVLR